MDNPSRLTPDQRIELMYILTRQFYGIGPDDWPADYPKEIIIDRS